MLNEEGKNTVKHKNITPKPSTMAIHHFLEKEINMKGENHKLDQGRD